MKNPTYNNLDLKNWRDYPDILTDSLWLFPQRATDGCPMQAPCADGGALFLLGNGARAITGEVLTVDAGWSVSG